MYRGRLAPTPTGLLHLGHARTFWTAQQRSRKLDGNLLYRNEDLDPARASGIRPFTGLWDSTLRRTSGTPR